MGKRALATINLVVVAGVIFWNYWTAIHGFAGNTVGGMSDDYDTLFTPASWAFSIWGLIFLGLVINALYQMWLAFRAPSEPDHRASFFAQLGPWLILTNIANVLWTVVWLSEQTAVSVLVLSAMFVFLTIAMRRLDMERWDAPIEVIALVWWPIVIYAGWVTVAVLANLSAFLAKQGWVPGDSQVWAIAMIAIATAYNLFVVARRNLREHAVVAVWAFVAIAARRWDDVASVKWTAVSAAVILMIVVSMHAWANRRTLPFVRRRA